MNLEVDLKLLLEDARQREQYALDSVPMLVENGMLTPAEADEMRKLCQKTIDAINTDIAKL